MKLGVISDLHGDDSGLLRAWTHLCELKVERVVCAGDLVGYGPNPTEVAAFLAERGISAVRGNHDRWAIERGWDEVDEFGGGSPSETTLDYLRTLPRDLLLEGAGRVGLVVHGSPRSDLEFVRPWSHPPAVLREELGLLGVDLLIGGHTHEPMWYRCDRGLVVNPGSVVSLRVVPSSRSFAVVDLAALEATFHDVDSGRAITVPPWTDLAGD